METKLHEAEQEMREQEITSLKLIQFAEANPFTDSTWTRFRFLVMSCKLLNGIKQSPIYYNVSLHTSVRDWFISEKTQYYSLRFLLSCFCICYSLSTSSNVKENFSIFIGSYLFVYSFKHRIKTQIKFINSLN